MNDFSANLLLLAVAAPLVCAASLSIGVRLGRPVIRAVAFAGFVVPAAVALYLWSVFPTQPGGDYAFLSRWPTGLEFFGIHLTLGLNGISLPLFVMAGVVGLAAGLFALQSSAERKYLYLLLLLVMQGGLMGIFASVDLFFFYFFHELALVPTFILVGIWGGRDRNYAAMKLTIYLTLGAMLSLIGLIAIYVKSGAESFDLLALRQALSAEPIGTVLQQHLFGFLLFGFGILVSLFPFHTWAPLGYGAAPSSAAMLHAGVLKKFGLYGLLQIAVPLLPAGAVQWSPTLAWLALGNVLIVGYITVAQRDLKQMVGYGSVMHMGYCFLGLATLSTAGAGGVVLLMVAHGLSVALLFQLATCVHHRTGTFDFEDMGGLARQAPVLAAFFVAATLASIGLPGFANFWGELTIFVALWNYEPWMVVGAVFGVVISAVYGLRAAARIFFGEPSANFTQMAAEQRVSDLRLGERIPALILLAALLLIGFWPKSVSVPLNPSLEALFPAAQESPDEIVHR